MEDAHRQALALQLAGHVQQAAEVAAEQDLGPGALDGGSLFSNDGVGDRRVLDAEGAAEAAADIVAFQRHHLQLVDRCQQLARLGEDAELAQARAAVMVGGSRRKGATRGPELHHVDQEAGQLEAAPGQAPGAFGPGRVIGQRLRVMRLDHADAGTRGRHDIVVGLEDLDEAPRQPGRVPAVAAVEGGLAAAGLRAGHLDLAAGLLQQLQRREADVGSDRVDQAGHEQRHPRGRGLGGFDGGFAHLRCSFSWLESQAPGMSLQLAHADHPRVV